MTVVDADSQRIAQAAFDAWLDDFGSALESRSIPGITACFGPDDFWKDVLAFTWSYRTFRGHDEIASAMSRTLDTTAPVNVRVAAGRTPPRVVRRGVELIEGFFDFDTAVGTGTGFVRLRYDAEDPMASKAWIVLTTLQQLRDHEERIGERRPTGTEYSTNFAGPNWLDKRIASKAYEDRDPQVLVVGGGQAGLIIAARLGQMGVDTLVVEKLPRVGDVWRNRYHSLTLHNEVWANEMPYMPFPSTWPTFVPKDMLAGFLEAYAEALEINVWTETEFVGGEYDTAAQCWTARVRRADGSEREFRVPHIVLAVGGASGIPKFPELPGLADFEGEVVHSSRFSSGLPYAGRRAIVVGTGTSAHDVAQDLQSNGAAEITMIQRSPTCVVSLVPSGTLVYALYSEGPPVDDIDLITASVPYPVLRDSYQGLSRKTRALDAELLEGLERVGFETDYGPDDTGFHMMYLRRGGGYYLNVGCSELIAEGKIGVVPAREVERFTESGVQRTDGTGIGADLVVLATGYENLQEGVRRLLGDEVADRVGPIWGFDENHIMRNMWQRTAQPGFWVTGGSLIDSRLHSRFLALQICADLHGMLRDVLAV